MWLLFFLSSIPIHLIFNSSIFSADDRGSQFDYLVFDESVLTGGAVYDPGASLSVPYTDSMIQKIWADDGHRNATWENMAEWEITQECYFEDDHFNRSRMINTTVEKIILGDWHKLDTSSCASLYNSTSCSGLHGYRNVAIILSGSSGWNRSQVWDIPANESSLWDTYMPTSVNNSFWFAHLSNYSIYPCSMGLNIGLTSNYGRQTYCENNCSDGMGFDTSNSDMWRYWPLLYDGADMASGEPAPEFYTSSWSIEYCLAEPFETVCQIGVASILLWVVSLCVLLKAVLCFVVIARLGKETSLVTPGDAIESFITHPPDHVLGPCLLEQRSLRSCFGGNRYSLVQGPIQWIPQKHRRWYAIPKRTWLSSYCIFSIGVALLAYFSVYCYRRTGWVGSFGQDAGNDTIAFPGEFLPTFEQAILIANSPQLFLSFAYLAFNSLFTRLHMAKEWSALSTRYKALRVTNPQGQQNSTYFLQLPYRYSVPILIMSILLHWVLSGCIYLLVVKGSYLSSIGSDGPFDSVMAVGYSTKSLVILMTLTITLVFMPPIFGVLALPSNTVVVGSNSLAIAAACQVSPLVGQNQLRTSHQESRAGQQDDDMELHHLMPPSPSIVSRGDQASASRDDEEERKATLLRVSQSKIRWGVVKMPSSWEEEFNRRDIAVEHISFGLPEDDVQQPVVRHWYA